MLWKRAMDLGERLVAVREEKEVGFGVGRERKRVKREEEDSGVDITCLRNERGVEEIEQAWKVIGSEELIEEEEEEDVFVVNEMLEEWREEEEEEEMRDKASLILPTKWDTEVDEVKRRSLTSPNTLVLY